MAGRDTLTADAVPRSSDARQHPRVFELHQLGSGADRYTLEIDAQRGVLLQVTASRDGRPFQRITTDQIAFDHPIAQERFRFEPPPGEEIQPTWGRHSLVHLSMPDAQQRAPFTVLIPDRIPPDWHSTCAFIEPSHRPPSPAAISLNYHSDDGYQSVWLSQYSASEKPDQYENLAAADPDPTRGRHRSPRPPHAADQHPTATARDPAAHVRHACLSKRPSRTRDRSRRQGGSDPLRADLDHLELPPGARGGGRPHISLPPPLARASISELLATAA